MVFGIVAVMSIALADTYFVGQLGTKPLAALSFTFPVTMTVTSLAIGLSAGSASVVSRAIGTRNHERVKRLSSDSIILALSIVIILSIIGYFTINPLFSLIGAKGETLDMVGRYMRIWYISMPFLVVPMVVNALIRSAGDAFWPSVIMICAALVNIGLTPLFIFGYGPIPAMDIEGAAIGTFIARAMTFFLAGGVIIFREKMVSLVIPSLEVFLKSCREIIKIAIPAALGNAVNPIGIGVVTAIIAMYGEQAVAAFGAATRIETFLAIPMLAMSSAIGPIAGQNWGAGEKSRVLEALRLCFILCLIWAAIMATLLYFGAPYISPLFTDSVDVGAIMDKYLKIVPITLAGYGFTIVAAGCYNAIGKPLKALISYLIRTALFYAPFAWILTFFFEDVVGIFYGIALANVLAGLGVFFWSWARLKYVVKCEN
jgi:putative MATE family efflux protein